MRTIDWRELYAANRATIEAAGVRPGALPIEGLPLEGLPVEALRRGALPAEGLRPGSLPGSVLPGGGAPAAGVRTGAGRRHVVHAPPGAGADGPVPLVVLLHGCTQDAASFAAATRMDEAAERHRFVTLHLEQGRAENPQGCWNWFLPEHQAREGGEPAWIASVVREVLATCPVALDPARVFIAGLSAGGAMAAILGATHPELVAAVGVHSGLVPGAAHDVASAFAAMANGAEGHARGPRPARAVPTVVVHGTADRTVAPVNAEQVLRAALEASRATDPDARGLDPARPAASARGRAPGGLSWTRSQWAGRSGALLHELLLVDGLGHAWSGGTPGGSHTDPRGPSATDALLRFFAQVARERAGAQGPARATD